MYMILIFILSSIPSVKPPDLGINAEDKIAHVLEYAVLGTLLARTAHFKYPFSFRLFLMIFFIGALYGISDEIHQAFVPNRFSSPWDALADAVGVFVGQAIYWKWKMRRSSMQ
ncbi:VanZ family protein [bacterium]|nr:VanZ family protein [bacterium]